MFGLPTEVIVTVISAVGAWWMKKNAQDAANLAKERELHIKVQQANSLMMMEAEKRSPWLRKFVGVVMTAPIILGLVIFAFFPQIPVSILHEVPEKSFLFGLIKWGGGIEVIQANGFVLPEWVRYVICTIIGFLFGPGFAKTR